MDARKYPIGQFEFGKTYTFQEIRKNIRQIDELPKKLKKLLNKNKSVKLEQTYRPGGWTARQVIHHIADSHINAYTRFKLACTETNPIIRPYDEVAWAELNDGAEGPIDLSVQLISTLHKRMVYFLESLNESDFQKTYVHPASGHTFTLAEGVAMYAWHGKHHLRHLKLAFAPYEEKEEKIKKTKKDVNTVPATQPAAQTILTPTPHHITITPPTLVAIQEPHTPAPAPKKAAPTPRMRKPKEVVTPVQKSRVKKEKQ